MPTDNNLTSLTSFKSPTVQISITLILLALIGGMTFYHTNDRKLMAANVDSAISKGIDPLSVRCSYASSSDIICIAFASSMQSHNTPSIISSQSKK
jgi:hypothetical protein